MIAVTNSQTARCYVDNTDYTSYRPGAARRYALRRWQFDSRRIHVRPRTGPQSAHGYAASSQRAYSLRQLRARPQQQTHHCCCRSTGQTDALQTDGRTDGHSTVLIRSQRTMSIVLPPQPSFSSSGLTPRILRTVTDTSEHIRFFILSF